MTYRLSDSTIAHIAQLLQLAIVTQTDLTQLMRGMVMEPSELDVGRLQLNADYLKSHETEIEELNKKAHAKLAEMAAEQQKKPAGFVQ